MEEKGAAVGGAPGIEEDNEGKAFRGAKTAKGKGGGGTRELLACTISN